MWLYLIWDLVKTLQRNDLYRTINSLRHLRVLQNGCNLTSLALVEKFLSKRIFSFQKVDISLVHGIVSLCRVPIFWFKFMLSPTNSPFFQSDPHAVVCNKFGITDKPLHKHDSNKYQSKAFFICNQRSFQTRTKHTGFEWCIDHY